MSTPIPFARPWIGDEERSAVLEVLDGDILTHGPQGKQFEAEFGTLIGEDAYCVAVSSCMAALHLSYLALEIGSGDEVVVPAQTHVATAHAVEAVGARPVFVDCDPRTGNVKPAAVEAAVTPRTRAISLVHFVGIPADMDAIVEVAGRHDLRVIEDCALAVGTRFAGVHAGMFGDTGCFSFYPAKHLTTGEGGMLVTRHAHIAERVALLRGFGVDRSHTERSVPGIYDVVLAGLNYRMSEVQAAIGRCQVRRAAEILKRRAENFHALAEKLRSRDDLVILDSSRSEAESSHYCLSLVLPEHLGKHRDAVALGLRATGVGSSIYYPHPVPRLRFYRQKYGYDVSRYAEAAAISDRSVALPVGPHLAMADVDRIADVFLDLLGALE